MKQREEQAGFPLCLYRVHEVSPPSYYSYKPGGREVVHVNVSMRETRNHKACLISIDGSAAQEYNSHACQHAE